MMEIERKWLIDRAYFTNYIWDESRTDTIGIVQGYITTTDNVEVRIRKTRDMEGRELCYMTTKSKGDLIRTEVEITITYEQFLQLMQFCGRRRIAKTRFTVSLPGLELAYVDIYSDQLYGLNVVEVEFDSVSAASNFIVPHWFGEEVTYNKQYKNSNLAQGGVL